MSRKSLLFLCGMPGCGKSTLGKKLAEANGFLFVDSDKEIERSKGASIPEIFAREGEGVFRLEEEKTIERLCGLEKSVVSLGGGSLEFGKTLERIKKMGLLIWVDTDLATILSRLLADTSRPLLKNADGSLKEPAELEKWLKETYEKRRTRYLTADIHFSPTGNPTHDSFELLRCIAAS